MIQLTENMYYNPNLLLEGQEQEVIDYIAEYYGNNAVLIPPDGFSGETYEHQNGYTVYDQFLRPVEVCVRLGNNIEIVANRVYIDNSTAWRLHSETLTVKTNTL